MNHVYHYYAFRCPGITTTHMDGVLLMKRPIVGADGFKLAKQLIATFNDVPVDGLILSGLNYLGLSEGKTAPLSTTGESK